MVNLNLELSEKFKTYNINEVVAYNILLSIYFNLDLDLIVHNEVFKDTLYKLYASKIITNENKDVIINEVLFNDNTNNNLSEDFEWILRYRKLFRGINSTRSSTNSTVLSKIKKFLLKNPSIKKEEITKAFDEYLSEFENNKTNSSYLNDIGNFILKKVNGNYESKLLSYIELNRDKELEAVKNLQNHKIGGW